MGFFKENKKISLFLFFLLIVSFFMMISSSQYISSIGSNLVAGFIQTIVTLYGIDLLISYRDQKRDLPIYSCLYEDIRMITVRSLSLWHRAYEESVGDDTPKNWSELLSSENINKISYYLDLNKATKVIPEKVWSIYLDDQLEEIHTRSHDAMQRYIGKIAPEVYQALHTLSSAPTHKYKFQSLIKDLAQWQPGYPAVLASRMIILPEWFSAVLVLSNWTEMEYKRLSDMGENNLKSPYKFKNLNIVLNPIAFVGKDVLEKLLQNEQ